MAEYLQVLTPSSPSGDIGCAPDNAGCSAGGAYWAYLEEEEEEEEEKEEEEEEASPDPKFRKSGS